MNTCGLSDSGTLILLGDVGRSGLAEGTHLHTAWTLLLADFWSISPAVSSNCHCHELPCYTSAAEALALLRDTAYSPAGFCIALCQDRDSITFVIFVILTNSDSYCRNSLVVSFPVASPLHKDQAATSFSHALHQAVQSNEVRRHFATLPIQT